MEPTATINQTGKVLVSVTGLRRLISSAYQAEMVEEMLADALADRTGVNAYRIAGLAANCIEIERGTDPGCDGIIYLDRERHCDECGRQVFAPEVVTWIKEAIQNGGVVKSFGNMDTEEFWEGQWAEFERIENCPPGELARMVGG
jgi:hypothetical protein